MPSSGEPRAAPPWSWFSSEQSPPAVAPLHPSRPIRVQRARLDRARGRLEPPDPDPSIQIQRYRFGLVILLKSP
jgi:hypothetical protein